MTGDTNNNGSASVLPVRDKYDEVFQIELECWCYGLDKFPGEMSPSLLHRVIKEMQPVFRAAVDHNYVFDLHYASTLIAAAVRNLVEEKEVTFSILAQLPPPYDLSEDAQFVLAQIIDQAEQRFGGVLERLEKRWRGLREKENSASSGTAKIIAKPAAANGGVSTNSRS